MSTIYDVAKEAGVSKSTVSRVLNRESSVKEETRIKVEEAIHKLKYSPSYFAQGIRTGKTKTIAMIVPEYTNVFYSEMFRGVEDVALEHGYMVLVCNTERHVNSLVDYTKDLLKRNIDGIIYNTYSQSNENIRFLTEVAEKLPVVFMNRIFAENGNQSFVVTDGYESTRKAVRYLYNHNRRRIGYVRNTKDISVIEDRYEGYIQGLKDCQLSFEEELVYQVQSEKEPDYIKLGQDAACYFLELKNRPDSILTAIDTLAIGCVQQFKREKILIPDEMSIIGFDNIPLTSLIEPTITTISQPIRQLGQKAAEIIIAKIDGRKIEDKIIYDGELIIRDTTC
jgi:DNA-binding LacI/PurR family transcriptional regulator